ncbi:sulfotransferase 1C2-like [Diadema antillarum]|uniref:sulfotransferase 1C2-like n=1 Tax=Diadema antillarum TaxID=105358 RepID=UPI003A86C62B
MSNGNQSTLLNQAPAYVADVSYENEGVLMPKFMPARCVEAVRNFTVRDDDIFLITYPKSGTTWAQQIVLLAHHNGDENQFEGKHIMKMVPFLEVVESRSIEGASTSRMQTEIADEMPSPRILKTQVPTKWLPESIRDSTRGKVIYVARNPKDMMVSYFHFCKMTFNLPTYESWDVFYEEFVANRVPRGSWFDSVLFWWKKRNEPNVLFLKYENMKKDLKGSIRQISDFMGKSFSEETIDAIVKGSTFDAMKKNKTSNPDRVFKRVKDGSKSFMRKGIIGDWKNYFSDEQSERFDKIYAEKLAGSGLHFTFEQE